VVQGSVATGFDRVEEVFAKSDLGHGGGAFAAYVDGEKVVDLWGGEARPGTAWAKDTLTTIMSTTKGCAALCAMVLHARGLLDVEAPVAQYWPEYAQAGKERTTVRQVLDHTSGMLCFSDPGALLDWTGCGWDDQDEIARRIAASPPAWEPGTRIGYHAISIGWLLQELVRRIDGRTLGTFFADEIARPLDLDIFIGTPPEAQDRVAQALSGRSSADDATVIARVSRGLRSSALRLLFNQLLARPGTPMAQAGISMHGKGLPDLPLFVNLPQMRALEIPAANGSGDARSLARMYALLARGGELDGTRLVSAASVELFRTPSSSGPSALMPRWLPAPLAGPQMRYALGYEGDFSHPATSRRFGPTPESFGHLGAGGQVGFADPVRKVSVGFVRNSMADWSVSTRLVQELYACL
jgi:CubicO group peptidase (beta-lactamase class C family)